MNHLYMEDTADYVISETARSRFFGPTPAPVRVDVGALTHPGKVRENNEDHFAVVRRRRSRTVLLTNLPDEDLPNVDEDAYALVVADGIGGAAFGELASRLALRTAGELGLSEIKWPLKVNEEEAREMLEKLETYAELLQEELVKRSRANPTLRGMGTTLTAAYTVGAEAFIAHIGDSRAYLLRGGALERLTRDHTLAQEMIDAGLPISDASQMRHLNRVLTNCLGAHDGPIRADVLHLKLQDADRLLLCTDGLSDLASDKELAEVLASHDGAQQACNSLVDLALDRGGKDNITAIVAGYELMKG